MKILKIKSVFVVIAKVFLTVFLIVFTIMVLGGTYYFGLVQGYIRGRLETQNEYLATITTQKVLPTSTPTRMPQKVVAAAPKAGWGGPDLWRAVNSKRLEFGVNSLNQRDELCTVASIRLNELLDLGKLDGHEGFSNMKERRPDMAWIFEKYSTIAEFLAMGGRTPEETVSLWENTLGHRKLLDGGEYVWGCIYAQDTFAVAITAF